MRLSRFLPILLLGVFFIAPHFAHAATLSWNPIISQECTCDYSVSANGATAVNSAPAWGCVLQTIQNVMNLFVSFAAIFITILLAKAGFEFMMSGGSQEARSKARTGLTNAVLGLLIVLCAWLLVDSIMKVLYSASNANANSAGVQFGPWNSILATPSSGGASNPNCLAPRNPPNLPGLTGSSATSNAAGGTGVTGSATTAASPPSVSGAGGACSASAIESAVQAEGGSIPNTTASVLACVAGNESSCGTNPKALVPQNNGSSALGPFQVTVQTHAPLFNNPQCEAAAGVSGPLNCQNAFTGGNPIPGTTLTECETAADNLGCESVVASQVYNQEGIGAWITSGSCAQ